LKLSLDFRVQRFMLFKKLQKLQLFLYLKMLIYVQPTPIELLL
jgi:hypothetical protein